jgi:hypothetical protein
MATNTVLYTIQYLLVNLSTFWKKQNRYVSESGSGSNLYLNKSEFVPVIDSIYLKMLFLL